MKVAILSGSVYGTAEEVARHAQKLLSAAGLEASHLPAPASTNSRPSPPRHSWW